RGSAELRAIDPRLPAGGSRSREARHAAPGVTGARGSPIMSIGLTINPDHYREATFDQAPKYNALKNALVAEFMKQTNNMTVTVMNDRAKAIQEKLQTIHTAGGLCYQLSAKWLRVRMKDGRALDAQGRVAKIDKVSVFEKAADRLTSRSKAGM